MLIKSFETVRRIVVVHHRIIYIVPVTDSVKIWNTSSVLWTVLWFKPNDYEKMIDNNHVEEYGSEITAYIGGYFLELVQIASIT